MKIILGSASPRRKELLQAAGFSFDIRVKDTDESYPTEMPSEEVALFVASKKLHALLEDLEDDTLLICADTTVVVDHDILNKPKDASQAKEMLQKLSGRAHNVITGVCIASKQKSQSFSVITRVHFKELSSAEIDFYIREFEPLDKAGSYGIQEWIGHTAIVRIEGSYNNVVGLPTHEVYEALQSFL
ncbi:MAG: Maf family nucleotide pyrophosphatase [Flavobacteriia bacterium]|jgi:septum formation protein